MKIFVSGRLNVLFGFCARSVAFKFELQQLSFSSYRYVLSNHKSLGLL